MAALLLTHVHETTSDDEIKAFLNKYGLPSFDEIQRVPSTGGRPAVLLKFNDASAAALQTLVPRIHNVYWKERTITAMIMRESPGE
ncbi:RNA-binding protein [Bordetella genomosp. 13]|uniref:RNA-binding protein n=1 Tax=Bordetella genomosp. 13 TaxID=463040 RepID=A0A1W6ZH20_9BORD|nr:RNA-binding protein [Bordetella genomosp. 13]ARP96555.1 hypothetical protein CAL15_20625 [Bordetella genomosp. 13]